MQEVGESFAFVRFPGSLHSPDVFFSQVVVVIRPDIELAVLRTVAVHYDF